MKKEDWFMIMTVAFVLLGLALALWLLDHFGYRSYTPLFTAILVVMYGIYLFFFKKEEIRDKVRRMLFFVLTILIAVYLLSNAIKSFDILGFTSISILAITVPSMMHAFALILFGKKED
ncbi:hypothetical protein WAK64_21300 [Bacillus spongiae]|uniref:Permease n=1 Tax=Bacillus spongiae TaxID=2683610 RepID=A0ABU8HKK1_9BACI